MGSVSLSDLFFEYNDNHQLVDMSNNLAEDDDFLPIFDGLEGVLEFPTIDDHDEGATVHDVFSKEGGEMLTACLVSQKSAFSSGFLQESLETDDHELETSRKNKRFKASSIYGICSSDQELLSPDGQPKISHITVERNRRKQMNEHFSVLRSLMPSFYVKRGDQASIIGGVVDYIKELQQVLQSLEAKKQRKIMFNGILSPRLNIPISPRLSPKPPLSPRLNINLQISPRTPQPSTSPYKPPRLHHGSNLSPTMANSVDRPSPSNSSNSNSTSSNDYNLINHNELGTNSKSEIAQVEVNFSGPNVLLKTVSARMPGQAVNIISAIEHLSLEILHVEISTVNETMLYSFTIKIGIECQLSAEELAHQIQQTFYQVQ